MPYMDETGPYGTGPVGRGMGPCGGGHNSRRGGWGMRGFRWGRGFGRRVPPKHTPEDEKKILENQKSWLKTQLEAVEKQISDLDQPTT